jgi:2-polyprenyl-3-methyl-5-hydroxy-6-metoxy-1,4-benzoquinol methylase
MTDACAMSNRVCITKKEVFKINTLGKKELYKGFGYHQEFKRGIGLKYQKVFEVITDDQSILEIGCHTGSLGEALKKRGNRVWGIEINSDAAEKAKPFYEKVLVGDIEDDALWDAIIQRFDVIIFLDVLEHLVDPWKVLAKCKKLLKTKGFILISIPNVAFYAVRRGLLFGRFNYQPSGILDKTHLRFFTFHSAQRLIQDCGYEIKEWYVTLGELPFEYKLPFLKKLYDKCKPLFSKLFPNLFGAVVLFKAIPVK